MGVMGFGAQPEEQIKDALKDLQKTMQFEAATIYQFEQSLYQEIRQIEEFKQNCLVIERYAETIGKIYAAREEAIEELHKETSNQVSEIDIQKCKDLIQHSNQANDSLQNAINLIQQQLHKHILRDSHELYLKEEHNRDLMNDMNKKLQGVMAKIIMIKKKNDGISQNVNQIYQDIEKLDYERKHRTEKKPPMGFHP